MTAEEGCWRAGGFLGATHHPGPGVRAPWGKLVLPGNVFKKTKVLLAGIQGNRHPGCVGRSTVFGAGQILI